MPDQNLGLVVELQANSPEDSNDPNELFSKGWTRIDLFDMSNRLLSGRYENSYTILIIISVGFFFYFMEFQFIVCVPGGRSRSESLQSKHFLAPMNLT